MLQIADLPRFSTVKKRYGKAERFVHVEMNVDESDKCLSVGEETFIYEW